MSIAPKRRLAEMQALAAEPSELERTTWPCACVKRRKGVLVAIKVHPRSVEHCRTCGATRARADEILAQRGGVMR